MADAKYNVIFLRDDQPVRRYRLDPVWIKFFLWTFFILLAAAIGGVYFSVSFWAQYEDLQQRRVQLEKLAQEKDVKLERLMSMSKVLREYDELGTQVALSAEEKGRIAKKEAILRETPAREPEPKALVDLAKLFASVNLKVVNLKNISLKPLDNKAFKLALDIGGEDGKPLTGQLGLSAITKDAKEFSIEAKEEELALQLPKPKLMAVNMTLPESLDIGQVFGLKITVAGPDGKTLFSQIYPLTQIMARKADD